MLLATACPDAERAEGVLYEHGDRQWYEHTRCVEAEDKFNLSDFYLSKTASLAPAELAPELRSGRGVFRSSPSRLEGGDEILVRSIFESRDNHELRTRGKMLHGCFELVQWLDESVPSKEQLVAHLNALDPTIDNVAPFITAFYKIIEHDNIRKLLSRSTYQETYLMEFADSGETMLEANRVEVHNERRFAVQSQSTLLEGQIDRLVLVYQGDQIVAADVIDFKSDLIDDSLLQGRIEHYRPQLTAYREAVSKSARIPLEKIAARLVFVESGKVVNLELVETSVDTMAANAPNRNGGGQAKPTPRASQPSIPSKPQLKPDAEQGNAGGKGNARGKNQIQKKLWE